MTAVGTEIVRKIKVEGATTEIVIDSDGTATAVPDLGIVADDRGRESGSGAVTGDLDLGNVIDGDESKHYY